MALNAQDGPSHVIVTHRVYPEKRGTFSNGLLTQAGRLVHWRDDGLISGFQVLKSALVDDEGFDAMLIAKTGNGGVELFKRLEQPEMTYSTSTVPADLILRGGDADDSPNTGVYLVSSWQCRAPLGGLMRPKLDEAVKTGGLLGYRYFEPRLAGGRTWNAMLVLHYPDWPALSRKDLTPFQLPVYDDCRQKPYVIAEPLQTK